MQNSSKKSAQPLHLILEPSRVLGKGIIIIHTLAVIAAITCQLPWYAKLILLGLVLFNFQKTYRKYYQNPEFEGITLRPDGLWEVMQRGNTKQGILGRQSVVTNSLVILHLKSATEKLAIPVFRDAVDPESFRELRVYLRTHGQNGDKH